MASSARNEILFEATDPRGRKVVCTKRCWYEHILANRAWMVGWEDEIITTIENPTYGIFRDANFVDRHVYYRRLPKKPRYIKVIVGVSERLEDTVITAYTTDSMKSGEEWIWTPKKG